MLVTILLFAVLFLAGILNVFFYFPTKKLQGWLVALSPYIYNNKEKENTPSPVSSTTSTTNKVVEKPKVVVTKEKKAELRKIFATFDKNGDGFITKQELRDSMKGISIFMTENELDEIIAKSDVNKDGSIDLEEFCQMFESMTGKDEAGQEAEEEAGNESNGGREVELKEAFDVFDKDKDGLISVEELGLVLSSLGLSEGKKMENCREMIKKVDVDGDGMVNFDEFKRMMKNGHNLLTAY